MPLLVKINHEPYIAKSVPTGPMLEWLSSLQRLRYDYDAPCRESGQHLYYFETPSSVKVSVENVPDAAIAKGPRKPQAKSSLAVKTS